MPKKKEISTIYDNLKRALNHAHEPLSRLYDFDMHCWFAGIDPSKEEYSGLEDQLEYRLKDLSTQICIALEYLNLFETREAFVSQWLRFEGNLRQHDWVEYDDVQDLRSPAYDFLFDFLKQLSCLVPPKKSVPESSPDQMKLELLEDALRKTANIVHSDKVFPKKEGDIQSVMNKHLGNLFDDYTPSIKIPKSIVTFEPDGGVISLKAALEFKFCDSEAEIKTAFHGVTEDLSAYGNSQDWTRFYTVLYQTKAFVSETKFQKSIELTGNAGKWTCIVVTGVGKREKKKKK